MPPTSIDGTDITGATIDGTDVTEITVNGQTVFTAGPPQPASGVSYWTFDNADTSGSTAIDVWGSNDGTISGATTGQGGANDQYTTNESYDFDGSDDVTVPHDSSLDVGTELSIAAFVNPDTMSGNVPVVTKNNTTGTDEWFFGMVTGGNVRFFLDNGNGPELFQSSDTISTSVWSHIVITAKIGGPVTGYIDGVDAGADTTLSDFGSDFNNSIDLKIGEGVFGSYFDGRIDDVRMYDKALSSSEVSDLYNNGSII